MLAAAGSAGDDDGLTDLLWAGWQEFGVAAGLPEQQMAGVLAEIRSRGKPATPDDYVRLLRAASFKQVTLYFNALNVIWGWLAR